MFYCSVDQNSYLFEQGDKAECFFIIDNGTVQVEIDKKMIRQMTRGQSFGELALLYNAPRSASIKTLNYCNFWAIQRKTFRKIVEQFTIKHFTDNRAFLDKVNFFQSMTNSQKDSIAHVLISQKFDKGQPIVNEGDQADSYYIIQEVSNHPINQILIVGYCGVCA